MATEQKPKRTRKKTQAKQSQVAEAAKSVESPDGGPAEAAAGQREGVTHMLECTCILPQYLRRDVPVFHKFVVFSIIDATGTVEEKFVTCNNCGIVHRVFDICKSEIAYGHDNARSALSIQDLKWSLPSRIVDLLEANNSELHVWEHAKFIVDEQRWGDHIVLSTEIVEGRRVGKFTTIAGPDKLGVAQFSEIHDFSTPR